MSVHKQGRSIKAVLLLPLAAALALFAAVHLYTYTHLDAEYTEEYVDNALLSAQRVFNSAVRTNTDKLSAALTVIARDEALKRAMAAGDRQALLQRANPVFERLREQFGITHFYFHRPDRAVFLRLHQPDRHGDVIDRFTAKQAQATGKLAAGLELGPSGTFTLRTVVPWREGDRLIGYLELGEELGNVLDSIREMLGLDVVVTIKKRYLSQQDWARGMAMLDRQGKWDALPDSVVVFQTRQSTSSAIQKVIAQEGLPGHAHAEISDQEGTFRTGHTPLIDAGGREVGNMLLMRDVTARSMHSKRDMMLAGGVAFGLGGALLGLFYLVIGRVEKRLASSQAEIRESEARFRGLVESSSDWIWEVDANARYVYASPKIQDLLGYTPAEVLGKTPFDFMPPEEAGRISQAFASIAAERGSFQALENRNLHKDGRVVVLETSGVPILNHEGDLLGYRGVDRDITARKQAEERISYLAYYDDLTGLPNRMLFKDRLSQAFIEADRKERLVGVMFLDIDHFKDVNDTLGHEAGNELLQAAAKRLQDCFRPSDTVARFGGDEFAVVLADVGHVDDAVQVAQHVVDGFKEPFDILGHEMFVTFSMGITLYPFDDSNVENLLRNADSAMYSAKAAGRNCYRFYAVAMTARATERLALQTGLRRALDQGEFILHYQPQLEFESGRVIGVEALVRWQHPDKGMIAPAQFIPVAEETGLIVPIGEWILREACLQAKAWQEQGQPHLRMAVNLSARQFKDPLFPHRVLEILNETGLDPQSLELEVTESILVDGLESVSAVLRDFKRAGIMISLDDFGTGYSSLSYLKRFPIDKLKIDQSFVRDVLIDADDASLVRAIIAMARALRLRVIAEGVETQEQFDFLRADGCDEIQGYHIARPMPAEQAADLILRYNTV
ncbi:MAG: EAL domain-containing protein [Hydrogenophilales bacterium]|nr:EAL domain-containing protein [Hydrogenophilales bacterium]